MIMPSTTILTEPFIVLIEVVLIDVELRIVE